MAQQLTATAATEAGLTTTELTRLVGIAREAAEQGGAELMRHYGRLASIESKGRVGDLVTNADLAAEKVVLDVLAAATPDIAVLAEESGAAGEQDGLRWCVDPLDGTTNFAHGYPFFATSIGLTFRQTPVLGAIAVPFLGEVYWGAPGLGAFCNEQAINVSSCQQLEIHYSSLDSPTTDTHAWTTTTQSFAGSPIAPGEFGAAVPQPSTWPSSPQDVKTATGNVVCLRGTLRQVSPWWRSLEAVSVDIKAMHFNSTVAESSPLERSSIQQL